MSVSPVDVALAASTGLTAFAFAVSGATKLGRAGATLQTMAALHVPGVVRRRWVAALLPVWELILAIGFLFTPGALRSLTAWLAVATLLVFTFFLAGVLKRREDVDCGCFGPLSTDQRVTGWSIVRNLVLIALAATVALRAPKFGTLIDQFLTSGWVFTLVVVLIWALVAVALLVNALWSARRNVSRAATASVDAAQMGDPIPDAEVVSIGGVPVSLAQLGHGSPVLLIFLSAECSTCVAVAEQLPEWQSQLAPIKLRLVTSSRPDVVQERFAEAAPYARYGAKAAMRALGSNGTPSAIMLGGRQHPVVASPVAHGFQEVESLVHSAIKARTG